MEASLMQNRDRGMMEWSGIVIGGSVEEEAARASQSSII